MQEAEIDFTFDVSVPPTLGITAVDAYILLGNALENAINACFSLPASNRYVQLQFKLFHDILFLKVRNPYSSTYQKRTRKNGHGYGLLNLKKCVQKYGGDIQVIDESFVFELSAHINIGEGGSLTK